MKLTVIVSYYNEEEALPFFYEEIKKTEAAMPYAEFLEKQRPCMPD